MTTYENVLVGAAFGRRRSRARQRGARDRGARAHRPARKANVLAGHADAAGAQAAGNGARAGQRPEAAAARRDRRRPDRARMRRNSSRRSREVRAARRLDHLDRACRACAAGRGRPHRGDRFRPQDRRGRARTPSWRARRSPRSTWASTARWRAMAEPLLSVRGLKAGYGDFQALFGVDLDLARGRGAGADRRQRRRQVDAAARHHRPAALRAATWCAFAARPIGGDDARPHRAARHRHGARGAAAVPLAQRRGEPGHRRRARPSRAAGRSRRVYGLFPILREKRRKPGTALSGGQQQMVAIGRALMANPELILFDEISLGLAPVVIKDIYAALPAHRRHRRRRSSWSSRTCRARSASRSSFVCLQEGRVSLAGAPGEHRPRRDHRRLFRQAALH